MTLGELGKRAGGVDYAAVGMALSRFESKMTASSELRREAALIEQQMLNVDSAEKPLFSWLRQHEMTVASFLSVGDRVRSP
jgi:hypothetical protein